MAALGEVRLKFPALDFAVVPGGFLFYNMNADDNLGQVVYTDNDGKVIGSFLPRSEPLDMMLTDKVFADDGYGNVYFVEPNTNTIYQWNDGALDPAFTIGSGDGSASASSAGGGLRSRLSFVFHKYVLTQFLSGRYLLNNIFDRQARSSRAGMVKTGTRFPFMPQCQGKDKLFCVCHPFDIGTNRESRELFLVTYSLR